MLKMIKRLCWILLVCALLIGGDQLLVRVPLETPGVTQLQDFYIDFRSRLLALAGFETSQPDSIEQLLPTGEPPAGSSEGTASRYLYVDESGALQFADSLQEVPARYRSQAQPLAD